MQCNGCMLLAQQRICERRYIAMGKDLFTDWWCWAQIFAHQTYPVTPQSRVQLAAQAHVR